MIPKILHRIRLGNDRLPPEAEWYEVLWRRLHPHWEHRLWTMENLPPLRNRPLFDACENTGHRSDILRLELIAQTGGVYVDLDMLPQKPLDPLLECPGFLGQIPPVRRDGCVQRIETAILAAEPKNPFVTQLVEVLPSWVRAHSNRSTAFRTGPQFVQGQIDRWEGTLPMVLHPPRFFYPYLWCELDRWIDHFPEAYAVHRWWGTWRSQDERLKQTFTLDSIDLHDGVCGIVMPKDDGGVSAGH